MDYLPNGMKRIQNGPEDDGHRPAIAFSDRKLHPSLVNGLAVGWTGNLAIDRRAGFRRQLGPLAQGRHWASDGEHPRGGDWSFSQVGREAPGVRSHIGWNPDGARRNVGIDGGQAVFGFENEDRPFCDESTLKRAASPFGSVRSRGIYIDPSGGLRPGARVPPRAQRRRFPPR